MKQHIFLGIFITSIVYASTFSMDYKKPGTLESFTKKSISNCLSKENIVSGLHDCMETTIRLSESFEKEEIPACGLGGGAVIGACIVCNAFCKTIKNRHNNHND